MNSSSVIIIIRACCISTLALTGCYREHAREDAPQFPNFFAIVDAGLLPLAMPAAGSGSAADAMSFAGSGAALPPPTGCDVRELRAGLTTAPVDMVWVVDSSQSMLDEQERIQQTIGSFVADIEAMRFDVRLVMITANDIVPPPLGTDATRYRFVERMVGSNEPLQVLLDELPRYRDFLRPQAALHFVIVTDDESQLPASAFQLAMGTQLARPYVVHAVASPDYGGLPCRSVTPSQQCKDFGSMYPPLCGAAAIGHEYYALADATGGEQISVCVDDFNRVFDPLTEAVTRLDVPCALAAGPLGRTDIAKVTLLAQGATMPETVDQVVDAVQCAGSHYYYSDDMATGTRMLMLCPDVCTRANLEGAVLRVELECVGPA